MKFLHSHKWDFLLVIAIFFCNLIVQFYGIGKNVNVFTDEGIYLYAAKLINFGLIPYKDFFLIHLPFLIYLNAFILKIISFNMNIYHFIYIFWFFSALFPIYFIVLKITKNRLGSILAIIFFSTFVEMVQWDAHFFAIRQASLPFLSWCLFFIFIRPRQKLTGVLLFCFAASLITNLLIAMALITIMIFIENVNDSSFLEIIRKYKHLILFFSTLTLIYYFIVLLIPNSFNNIVSYQFDKNQFSVPISLRFKWLMESMSLNWPILIFGLLGTFMISKKTLFFSMFNLFSFGIIFLLGKAYYPHYLTILGLGLAISAGIFFGKIFKSNPLKIFCLLIVIILLFKTTYNYLRSNLIDNKNLQFFYTIAILKNSPEPLFTMEPIYAVYANKNLLFHYFVADMRSRRVLRQNLGQEEYLRILEDSKTILLEPFTRSFLPPSVFKYINTNFNLIYSNQDNQIYLKND